MIAGAQQVGGDFHWSPPAMTGLRRRACRPARRAAAEGCRLGSSEGADLIDRSGREARRWWVRNPDLAASVVAARRGLPRRWALRLGGWSVERHHGVFGRTVTGSAVGWRCPGRWAPPVGRPAAAGERRLVELRSGRWVIRRGARPATGGIGSTRSLVTVVTFVRMIPLTVRHRPESRDPVALSDCDHAPAISIPGTAGRSIRGTVVRVERAFGDWPGPATTNTNPRSTRSSSPGTDHQNQRRQQQVAGGDDEDPSCGGLAGRRSLGPRPGIAAR